MCAQYEDGFSYLKKDTSIKCWEGKDFFFQVVIAVTFITLWAIIFPVAIYCRINREKGRLNHPNNLKLYGIFYIGLNDNTFYWEIIVMNIRKIAIIAAATFFSNSKSSLKGYIGILAIFLQRHFSHYKMPFIDPRFNEIENLASISSITILFGGLILLQGDDD
jgi:putative lipase involved disintegration of autophagic bodies